MDTRSTRPAPGVAPTRRARPAAPPGPARGEGLAYIPPLDGVRALAVLGVMAYHGGIPWLVGGYLGVDTFFVLSGFLITSLLLAEWGRVQAIRLRAFWARRARRLLPALLVMLVFVACYAAFVVASGTYPGLRGDELSTLFYVANWHYVLAGSDYFARTALPSPLTPTWSLAIEEQFYLVWPLLMLGILALTRSKKALFAACTAGAVASAAEMAVLYRTGAGTTRLYYGTDTHAQSLLVGAALAAALAIAARGTSPGPGGPGARRRHTLLAGAGVGGAAVCAALWSHATGSTGFVYQGGFFLADVATAAVLLSVVRAPRSPVAVALSWAPLRYLGRISYGMYLWHYPLFLVVDGARTGLTGDALFAVRAAATVGVATVSYYAVERPIRQGTLFRRRRAWALTPPAVGAVVAAVVALTSVPVAAVPATSGPPASAALFRGPPVKVLVIGDSTALTLGIALSTDARHYDVAETNKAILGCGVVDGRRIRTPRGVSRVPYACSSGPVPAGTPQQLTTANPYGGPPGHAPDAEPWTAWYRHWVAALHPDVVLVLAGRWEVMTRTYHGHWTNILHPAFAAYVERQLRATIRLASSGGARVVLMTAPCYHPGEQPDGRPSPTASPARVGTYNRLLREAAAAYPGAATTFPLAALACPGGTFHKSIDGVPIRRPDGVHFAVGAGRYLGPLVWPSIVRIGRRQMAAGRAPAGGRAPSAAGPRHPSGAQR